MTRPRFATIRSDSMCGATQSLVSVYRWTLQMKLLQKTLSETVCVSAELYRRTFFCLLSRFIIRRGLRHTLRTALTPTLVQRMELLFMPILVGRFDVESVLR